MSIQLDHDELHRLLAALAESDIQEFRLEGEDFRLEVRRNLPTNAGSSVQIPTPSLEGVAAPASSPQLRVESAVPSSPPPAVPAVLQLRRQTP